MVTVSDDRSESEVTAAGALARAVQVLRRRRARAITDTAMTRVRFYPDVWGEKWMWAVMDREVSIARRNGRTVVEVRASVLPIALMGFAAAVTLTASQPPLLFALLTFIAMTAGNYAFAHAGMKALLRDTLSHLSIGRHSRPVVDNCRKDLVAGATANEGRVRKRALDRRIVPRTSSRLLTRALAILHHAPPAVLSSPQWV